MTKKKNNEKLNVKKTASFEVSADRKKMVSDLIHDPMYVPMKEKEIAIFLQVEKEDRDQLKEILLELEDEHEIECTPRGRYVKAEGGLVGQYISNAKGFGFVEIEGRDEDIFIPEDATGGAFLMDTVEVELKEEKAGKRTEGRVRRIIARGMTEVVGTWQNSRNYGFVIPDNNKIPSDIFVPTERSKGAVEGDKVVVTITDYGNPNDGRKPEGKVTEIIGNINDPGVDILSVVKGYDLPLEFPERVMNQAERTPDSVSDADREGRMDLRGIQMVTIDGEDAKDLDDAVSLRIENGLYHLGVHIADVSNYVQENSALDREALKRGTSVYLVDRVIPMLPHKLSNGICSLNHGEDRLAMSCLMTINQCGDVIDHQITESVINVDERMTYTSVAKILDEHDPAECSRYERLVPMFEQMRELADILHQKRMERGSIDFDFPETKIILDKDGNPTEIRPYERNTATNLIEDFMLIANETVAQHFFWLEIPFVYRTHEQPDPDRITNLTAFIRNFGYHLKTQKDEIHPKEIQKLLANIQGSSEEAIISRLALRSMMQAKYTTECTGHFGLATEYYCHFTSPIRRYPDLQIHRIIKDQLRGRMNEDRIAHYKEILPEVAKHASETERRADEAERETDKLKKAQFMEAHVGEVYEGVVSGVTGWGMFVELENTCEGLIRAASMEDDFYVFDEGSYSLVGESTGKVYKLGQRVKIKVVGADRMTRTIDFKLYEEEDPDADDLSGMPEAGRRRKKRVVIAGDPGELRKKKVRKIRENAESRSAESRISEEQDSSDGEERDREILKNYVPDSRTGELQPKHAKHAKGHGGRNFGSTHARKKDESGSEKSYGRKVTGKGDGKKSAGKKLTGHGRSEKKDDETSEKKGRKTYKVHKYKKSATSKAARSAQGKRN